MKTAILVGITGLVTVLSQVPDIVPSGLPSLLGTTGSLGILAWHLFHHATVAQPAERKDFLAAIALQSEKTEKIASELAAKHEAAIKELVTKHDAAESRHSDIVLETVRKCPGVNLPKE
jgi:hypothetical protein